MPKESWLVRKDRVLAMRFFQDKYPDEDGTTYMRVHYAFCRNKFVQGISPNVQLQASEKMTIDKARELWKSSVEKDWDVSEKPLWMTC